MTKAPEADSDVAVNRALWTLVNADCTDERACGAWAAEEVTWGLFDVPERELGVLGDVADLDVIELGCGTAYVSVAGTPGANSSSPIVSPARLGRVRANHEPTSSGSAGRTEASWKGLSSVSRTTPEPLASRTTMLDPAAATASPAAVSDSAPSSVI
jgi:hypothetical protein